MNKVEIINPTTILINCINTPHNTPINNILSISDSGADIHLAKQATNTMAPVIMSNKMTARLIDGSTMEYSHITTLQLPGLGKQARQIHNFPKTKTAPLISFGVLCDDG